MKKLFVLLLPLLVAVGCIQEERSPEEILVPSPAQLDCSELAFELSSKVPIGSQKLVDECGFLVATTKDLADAVDVKGELAENAFRAVLPSRRYGTTYYICSYVTNGHGSEIRSDVRSFALGTLDQYVSFDDVNVVSYEPSLRQVTLALHADVWAGVNVTEVGVRYGVSESLDSNRNYAIGAYDEDGNISISVGGIIDGDQYYISVYLKDGEYVTYGEIESLVIPSIPSLKTNDAEEITSSSAVLHGTVLKGDDITERGFMLMEGEGSTDDMDRKIVVDGTLGEYSVELNELKPNQKYSYCAYAINTMGTYYGVVKSFKTNIGFPVVASPVISSITSTSAVFSSMVTSHGGKTVSEVGFFYGKEPEVDPESALKVNQIYSEDTFSIAVEDLEVNTRYYVMAFTKNTAGIAYSEVESFTTSVSAPSVKTVGYFDVTSTTAVLSGSVVSDNGAEVTERGFVWMQGSEVPTLNNYKVVSEGALGEYSSAIEDLEPNRRYTFRAYASNLKGTSYGEVMTFSTAADLSRLSVTKVTGITSTTATFTSTVTDNGGATVSEVGFYYGLDEELSNAFKVSEGYSSDTFSITVGELEVGTVYYVKAYVVNSAGEATNTAVSFKTVSAVPSVSTVGFSEVSAFGARLTGEVSDDNGEGIIERGFVWTERPELPTVSDNKVQVLGGLGEYSAAVDGLNPNQTYTFRAYATNSCGTAYGDQLNFITDVALPIVTYQNHSDLTSSSMTVSGKVLSHGGETVSEVGLMYALSDDLDAAVKVEMDYSGDVFSFTLQSLTRATDYYIWPYAVNSAGTSYGDMVVITTLPVLPVVTTMDVTDIMDNSARCGGVVLDDGGREIISKGIVWGRSFNPTIELHAKTDEGPGVSEYISNLTDLRSGTAYYVRAYAVTEVGVSYGEQKHLLTPGEIESIVLPSANSFIITESGTYSFTTTKGNSSETIGDAASAEVLWETFGTSQTPNVGSLISSASYKDGYVYFDVPVDYREGNAVIAAKDESGRILWSWHIWLTDMPQEHEYANAAGVLMDRNLGATSATPGDVGAIGLVYQWGRKDPFLGTASTTSSVDAGSTIEWPSSEVTDGVVGTFEYAYEHPTTFIRASSTSAGDWMPSIDYRQIWQEEIKTIHDPCPDGWHVPVAGAKGSFSLAGFTDFSYDSSKGGLYVYQNDLVIWFPASGFRSDYNKITHVNHTGWYWLGIQRNYGNYMTNLMDMMGAGQGGLSFASVAGREPAYSIRCQKDGTGGGVAGDYIQEFSINGASCLSLNGNANCYMISQPGVYYFPALKGNGNDSVGPVSSVEVMWETLGTGEIPSKGCIVQGALYRDGNIYIKASDSLREGNAVIAARDAAGNILWSWHIWSTDEPEIQEYFNNAGLVMDRNLGATSATPGDVGALGLLYQWGRKDPFPGASAINSSSVAECTIYFPEAVLVTSISSPLNYSIANPTTFIKGISNDYDWCYGEDSNVTSILWKTDEKTIYDPCPPGWRVVRSNVYSIASGTSSKYEVPYDNVNLGVNFSGIYGQDDVIWYPASGTISSPTSVSYVGNWGRYWLSNPMGNHALNLLFRNTDEVSHNGGFWRSEGCPVRCVQE